MTVPRVVFDCNTYLQALASPHGPAGRCFDAIVAGSAALYVSPLAIEELRDVATRPKVARKLRIIPDHLNEFIEAILAVATLIDHIPPSFAYARDPDDAHYINLAIAADARLVVTRDQDLLDLMAPGSAEGRRLLRDFPGIRVMTPNEFLAMVTA